MLVAEGSAEISSASARPLGGTQAYASIAASGQSGVVAKFATGSFGLQRRFARVHSGQLEGGFKGFVSFSSLQYHK